MSSHIDTEAVARGLAEMEQAMAERDRLRAGIQWVRGMCTDEEPHTVIDAKLAEILNGGPSA